MFKSAIHNILECIITKANTDQIAIDEVGDQICLITVTMIIQQVLSS